MELDWKYLVGMLLLVMAFILFYTARIDLQTFLLLITTALAIMGYTAYQTSKKTKTK